MTDAANGAAFERAHGKRAQRSRLALGIMALFGLSGAEANTITVTSCTDAGAADTGNLRNSIAAANEGDTVDAGGLLLTCINSKITLTQGAITIARNNLTVQGMFPLFGTQLLTVDGQANGQNGMFRHTGTGQLTVNNLTLDHGYLTNNTQLAAGGAIYSAGIVSLRSVNIYHSSATTVSGKAYGGAVYAKQQVLATYANFLQNKVFATTAAGSSFGGAIFAKAGGALTYCTVSGNGAYGVVDNQGSFGGMLANGPTLIQNSLISGNTAHAHVGGLGVLNKTLGSLTLIDSTISGNTAVKGPMGGIWVYAYSMSMTNPTITLNQAGLGTFNGGGPHYAPGLAVSYAYLSMTNALIANNSYGATPTQNDLTLSGGAMLRTVTNNLVRSTAVVLPAGNKTGVCPLLGPLRNNGGLTKTHALLSHSPAIDAGGPANQQREDQRGKLFDGTPPPFPRLSGTATDIGAYEVQQNDIVFNSSFEGCP